MTKHYSKEQLKNSDVIGLFVYCLYNQLVSSLGSLGRFANQYRIKLKCVTGPQFDNISAWR